MIWVLQKRMLALKPRMGDSGASPNKKFKLNPVTFFQLGYLKVLVYNPQWAKLQKLNDRSG